MCATAANVLVLSGAKTASSLALDILESWLATPFAGGRHQRRIDKITQTELDLGIANYANKK
jgi:ribose 5-phosphate isomerase B